MVDRSRTPNDLTPGSSTNGAISIVISDANQMMCELLAGALKRVRSLKVLKCTIRTSDVFQAIADLQPDVALISTHLADGPFSGFKALRQLRTVSGKTRYVMLLDHTEPELVIDAFRAGARGVFRRSASLNLLYRCITAVHNGQVWASSEELQHVLEALQTAMPLRCIDSRGRALLSKREQQIVPLVAEGMTNKEISEKLKLSEHTVKNHLFRIYDKLGISSRVELILYAVTRRDDAA